MTDPYRFVEGNTPLLVSLPHDATFIPATIASRMTEAALATPDTDWHVARLYDFAHALGAHVLTATHSRYVVDLNRDPEGQSLYAGADNTELCPLTTFDQAPIYRDGQQPDGAEIAERTERYWKPYHDRLAEALDAIHARHGIAVLFDGHTIRSEVDRFFDGTIPDLNLGTADGQSADSELEALAFSTLDQSEYQAVLNGRFTGGYITRSHGRPDAGIHAIQLELTWRNYMFEAPPYDYRPDRADRLKVVLRQLLERMAEWASNSAPPSP
jgi:N-formylglutamate deformylase